GCTAVAYCRPALQSPVGRGLAGGPRHSGWSVSRGPRGAACSRARSAQIQGRLGIRRGRSVAAGRRRAAWLFLAPLLAVLVVVAAWPLLRTIYFSLTNATLVDMGRYDFVGLSNYIAYDNGRWYGVLTDPQGLTSLRNTLVFAIVSVSLQIVLGD